MLVRLITGGRCDDFKKYQPTARGVTFLQALWRVAFDEPLGHPSWFVSEYDLPVPPDCRDRIPFIYRCPDLATGDDEHVLIIELKTERPSYKPVQVRDFIELSRRKLPLARIDLLLLGDHRPGAAPALDALQRYAEITWHAVPDLLSQAFPEDQTATQMCTFLNLDLAAALASKPGAEHRVVEAVVSDDERDAAAVALALRLAPSVAVALGGDRTPRGVDVAFATDEAAYRAADLIRDAVRNAGFIDKVNVWLWRPVSGGKPATTAGHSAGRELRLQPNLKRRTGS